ncbi:hypothetical protein BI347_14925 [Chromobacterium sphagni]|uniref:DUF1460 domain-containing protein n=1 Tax=Chromobacterium sphagni TaxID=1903179 RepID=A0A1S1X595_9NEIS|nr:DUF1460 domain-containing protein [Chromobacterium sphagni]OHX14658.1 hypothetical protein BI347_14925 [Chromobacterium sphagni]
MRKVLLAAWLPCICTAYAGGGNDIDFHNINEQKLIKLFQENKNSSPGQRIKTFSSLFLGNAYASNRLIGSNHANEKLVVDFGKLDCFTYLDYVESLRRSDSVHNFFENVIRTRYAKGEVSYLSRKHFFSDWVSGNQRNIKDVTRSVSRQAMTEQKELNRKKDGSPYIIGLEAKRRDISYIPANKIDADTLDMLRDGDYIGIYTKTPGLDVTHTGIFIRKKDGPVFRNASSLSRNMKVVDSPFLEYVRKQPGIVVYRAVNETPSQNHAQSTASFIIHSARQATNRQSKATQNTEKAA